MCLPLFLFYPLAAAQTGGGKSRVKTEQRAKGTTAPDMDHFERLQSLYVQAKAERADFYSSMTSLLVFYGGQDDAGKGSAGVVWHSTWMSIITTGINRSKPLP